MRQLIGVGALIGGLGIYDGAFCEVMTK